MKRLFEYAVILQEKTEKGKMVEQAEVLVQPTYCLASDVNEVNILAARAIPEERTGDLERIVLAVRPF